MSITAAEHRNLDVRAGLDNTLLATIKEDIERWRRLCKAERDRARWWNGFDVALGIVTVVVAGGAAVTVWPKGIAGWVPGVLAVGAAVVAAIRSSFNPVKRGTEHQDTAASLDWCAERMNRLASDVVNEVISNAEAWNKHEDLYKEALPFQNKA